MWKRDVTPGSICWSTSSAHTNILLVKSGGVVTGWFLRSDKSATRVEAYVAYELFEELEHRRAA